jgi:glycine hydroxymethyltransferase
VTSGIRIGTPAVTTRGLKEPEMEELGRIIVEVLTVPEPPVEALARRVDALARRFPLPGVQP